jgi:hypothetical protein
MANEFQFLPNPTNIPEAVSTGYQRQNTNVFVLQTGIDTTEPNDDETGIITIPAGGVVEINGSLFKLTADISLTKPDTNIAYWIAVADNGDGTASLSLVTRPGIYNPAKKGCYTTTGARTLDWVSLGSLYNLTETAVFSKTTRGVYVTQLKHGWYYADLKSGLGGGDGADAGTTGFGGGGGVANIYDSAQKIFLFHDYEIRIQVGGTGGSGGSGGNSVTGSGGGGGSGGGEETLINGIVETRRIRHGIGGGGYNYGGGGGGGGTTLITSARSGGGGGGFAGGSAAAIPYTDGTYIVNVVNGGSGGRYGGYNGMIGPQQGNAAGGGGMGYDGWDQPDGSSGGYCNIYKLEN